MIGCSKKSMVETAMDSAIQNRVATEAQIFAGVAEELAMPDFNTEEYDLIRENTFKETLQNLLSTFSIDVDTAS